MRYDRDLVARLNSFARTRRARIPRSVRGRHRAALCESIDVSHEDRRLRIAWLGPTPTTNAGVAFMATEVLRNLPDHDIEVDVFAAGQKELLPCVLQDRQHLAFILHDSGWRYDRWYSSHAMSQLLTGQLSRLWVQRRLMRELLEHHAERPYDVIYQFSQFELPGLLKIDARLPAFVVHPETHAAGELRAHLRERKLAKLAGEPVMRAAATVAMFALRSGTQRLASSQVSRIVAPSENFARHLEIDYRVPRHRISVVPNPVNLERFANHEPERSRDGVLNLVVAGRISARKGIELVIELSHRLVDFESSVRLLVVGGHSLWSDYRPLLKRLNPAIGEYLGDVPGAEMAKLLASADMLIQPSHYEPFALTVGEALACGTPVVVSDQVGAGEHVDSRCCRRFVTGSLDGLEHAVRELAGDLRDGREDIRRLARTEATRLFAADVVVGQLADVLRRVAGAHAVVDGGARPRG
jgi:glycosyltransferase involved in cell wall biosynthesis